MARYRRLDDLSNDDLLALVFGPNPRWRPPGWTGEEHLEHLAVLWPTFRDLVLADWARNGQRPWAWWLFDRGVDIRADDGGDYGAVSRRRLLWLSAHGELSDSEVERYGFAAAHDPRESVREEAAAVLAVLDSEVVDAGGES